MRSLKQSILESLSDEEVDEIIKDIKEIQDNKVVDDDKSVSVDDIIKLASLKVKGKRKSLDESIEEVNETTSTTLKRVVLSIALLAASKGVNVDSSKSELDSFFNDFKDKIENAIGSTNDIIQDIKDVQNPKTASTLKTSIKDTQNSDPKKIYGIKDFDTSQNYIENAKKHKKGELLGIGTSDDRDKAITKAHRNAIDQSNLKQYKYYFEYIGSDGKHTIIVVYL